MLAAQLHGARDLRIEEVETPRPPIDWALVKSMAVGICGTDKAMYLGKYRLRKKPLIPGHEVVGLVVEGPSWLVGHMVVPEINFACGRCMYCRLGLYVHCPHRKTLGIDFDGGLAEYFIAPVNSLHIVDGLNPFEATQIEPLAAILKAFQLKPLPPGSRIAILGSGNLAYLASQVTKLMGLKPTVVVRPDSPKASLFRNLGIKIMTVDEALNLDDYEFFDAVFEATGDPSALDIAIRIVKPQGTIYLKSTPGIKGSFNITMAVIKEVNIIASRCGTYREFKTAIDLLRNGLVKPHISATYDITMAKEAFEKSLERKVLKVAVKIS